MSKLIDRNPFAASAIRELVDEEDIPADYDPGNIEVDDPDVCKACGVDLAPNDIHAGIRFCFHCDPPWSPTEG